MDSKKLLTKIATILGIENFKLEETELVDIVITELEDGTKVYSIAAIDLGSIVYSDPEMKNILPDGEYLTVDGIKFEIIDSVIGSISERPKDEEEIVVEETEETEETEEINFMETELIDGVIIYHVDEIAEGVLVFSDPEMTVALEDEFYNTVEGEILKVEGGAVVEITFVVEENEELKKAIIEIEEMKKEKLDLDTQIEELVKENEKLKKVEITLRAEIDNQPAVDSIKFGNEEIKKVTETEKKENIKRNREYSKFVFQQIKN